MFSKMKCHCLISIIYSNFSNKVFTTARLAHIPLAQEINYSFVISDSPQCFHFLVLCLVYNDDYQKDNG